MVLRVMYIDDEEDLCIVFQENFSSDQIEVTTFVDPQAALRKFPELKPHVVVVDYRLPNTTGDVVAKKLPPEVPKVLVTGDLTISPEGIFVKIFQKPYPFNEIEAFLNSLIPRAKVG